VTKVLVSFGFAIVFFVSLWIFFASDHDSVESNLDYANREPRIVVDDFMLYRYRGHQVVGTFTAKLGHFIEPNIVEFFASVKGERDKGEIKESLSCEAGLAVFEAEGMSEIINSDETKLSYVEVEDQVRVESGDHIIRTEFAHFDADHNLLSSQEPVQIDGPKRILVGEEGFEYYIDKKSLTMAGKVRGVVKSDD